MAVTKLYKCDICHDMLDTDKEDSPRKPIGLYWQDYPEKGWVFHGWRDCERHVCLTCLKSLAKIYASFTQ